MISTRRERRPDMAAPTILDGAENQAPKMPAALVQAFKLDRIEIGIIVQQHPIFHIGYCTISIGVGQHLWLPRKEPLSRVGMGGASYVGS